MKKIMRVNVGLVAVVSTLVAVPVLAISGAGGSVSADGIYAVHTFTESGTFTVAGEGEVEILVVAGGGGGGGSAMGGGGGAGGVIITGNYPLVAGSYEVVVGAGGTGGMAYKAINQRGLPGENSSFGTELVAIGGGGGSGWTGEGSDSTPGGSGGGGNSAKLASAGVSGQGHDGARGNGTVGGAQAAAVGGRERRAKREYLKPAVRVVMVFSFMAPGMAVAVAAVLRVIF